MHGKDQRVPARVVVEHGFRRRVGEDAAVPIKLAVDADPLGDVEEVGGRVEPRPEASRAKDGLGQGGHRALPVRAADVDEREVGLGVTEGGEDGLDPLEPRPHARLLEPGEAEEPRDRLGRGHGTAGPAGSAKNTKRRRRVSRSSLRSTTRSTIPCSRRNSAR